MKMHFDWIIEDGSGQYKERNNQTRNLIRRRATQAAALTRLRENNGSGSQLQSMQTWVIRHPPSQPQHEGSKARVKMTEPALIVNHTTTSIPNQINPQMPPSVLLERFINIVQDSTLSKHSFRALMSTISSTDEQVRYFLTFAITDNEYLQTVNSYYGQSICLDAAIDCVSYRCHNLIARTAEDTRTVRLYTRALLVLQKVISTSVFTERYNVYHAICLLVLFELLGPPGQIAYLTHGRGAVHLLNLIGPEGMETEFYQKLLAMQTDVMIIENLRDGYAHFATGLEWQQALQQAISLDLPPGNIRSEADLTLNIIATALPGALTHVENAVSSRNMDVDSRLYRELEAILTQLQNWQQRWNQILRVAGPGYQQKSELKVLLATFLMYKAMLYRFVAAAPGPVERRSSFEHNAYEIANEALNAVAETKDPGIIGKARLDVVAKLVHTIIETFNEWQDSLDQMSSNEPISQTLFTTWCRRIGRQGRTHTR